MRRHRIDLGDEAALAAQRDHIGRGGVLGVGLAGVVMGEDYEIELVNPAGDALVLEARAVWVGPSGIAFAFADTSPEVRAALAQWASPAPAPASEASDASDATYEPDEEYDPDAESTGEKDRAGDDLADADPDGDAALARPPSTGSRRVALNARDRVRGLTMVEQLRVARDGEATDRIALERMYGKTVWEALLRNLRLTQPEVTHLARMGALPRPFFELILGNPGWLQWPQVRRALLSNPRLGAEQAERVLRATPRNELRAIISQHLYPAAIRSLAKRVMGGGG